MTPFWKLYKASSCSLKLKGANQEEVFAEMVDVMVKGKALDASLKDDALKALISREKKASTGVGQNVAILHVKVEGLKQVVVSVGIHPEGVEWKALDGAPAQIFFVVLRPGANAPDHDPDRHLEMMRWIASLGREGDFRNFARAAKTRSELVNLLKEMSSAIG